ncbi:hypothetical protein C8R47DRAFT_1114582 [Mycena vitilis]|nr:hypothetical protein C8R47DRAFT_1114582 [Mycena vitilis]
MATPSPQKRFPIFPSNDFITSRRWTSEFETKVLQDVLNVTKFLFATSTVHRLVAISLKADLDPYDEELDVDSVALTDEDLNFAKTALESIPQLELVEGLHQEAIVVRSPDPTTNHPTTARPVRIQLRAERAYVLWQLAARGMQATPIYQRTFSFMVWVILHEGMHLVREYAFPTAQQKASLPRLRSSNKTVDVLWAPADSSNVSRFYNKGESGHWLEDHLTAGCSLEALDIPYDEPLLPVSAVPDEVQKKLKFIVTIKASKARPENWYDTWKLSDAIAGIAVMDPLATVSSVGDAAAVLAAILRHISTAPFTPQRRQVAANSKSSDLSEDPARDVFDATDRDMFPHVDAYLRSRDIPEPAEAELDPHEGGAAVILS